MPPGACDCGREQLVDHPQAAQRILLLTRQEEKRLLERLENLKDLQDLQRLQQRMYENLGIRVHIAPGFNEVRTMRGIIIELDDQLGLCRKTRQSIPAAIRRGWNATRRLPSVCSIPMICCGIPEGQPGAFLQVTRPLIFLQLATSTTKLPCATRAVATITQGDRQ